MSRTTIRTAYDAFWFLQEHPRFKCREALLISAKDAKTVKLSKGERIRKIKDSMPWRKKIYLIREFALRRDALDTNLDIFYSKVNEHGRVDDDATKNTNVECWLEFGPLKQQVSDGNLDMAHFHDIDLDCGAPTFDEALIKLARLVKRHYGDYRRQK